MQTNATVRFLGTEVVQSIQNLENDVPLLANKETVVRVYVRPSSLPGDIPVTGTLEVRRTNGSGEETSEIRSDFAIELRGKDIGDNDHSYVAEQRRSSHRSLNFRLDPSHTEEGKVRVSLKRISPALRGDPEVEIPDNEVEVNFESGPNLRVRAVGLRVRDPLTGDVHWPERAHFDALRSYLERAFPVSKLEWSDITVDAAAGFEPPYSDAQAPSDNRSPFWQRKFDIACAHLMAIRSRDMESGADRSTGGCDQRTHYYGLVYHPSDFFVGAVSNVPATPRPDVVGIGPAEMEDGSYGAHELAHSLGRLHAGACDGQKREDPDFPEEHKGKISSVGQDGAHPHNGFDVGDSIESPRVLPFDKWYDLMTYCEPLWVSDYSYKGILERLREEEKLDPKCDSGDYLQVVGTYNLDKNEGSLSYAFPVRTKSLAAEGTEPRVVVVGLDEAGKELFKSNVELKRALAADLPQNTGAFQITVSPWENLSTLELRVDGTLAASRSQSDSSADGLSDLDGKSVEVLPPVTSPDDPYLLKIIWPKPYDRDSRHSVQARLPDGNWRTIALGITDATKEVFLDRHLIAPPAPPKREKPSVEVRILRSSGFSETPIYEAVLEI